jgi:hypothetical protein
MSKSIASSSAKDSGDHAGLKTLRLTSTAAYQRPLRQDPTALTTTSTYDSGVGSLTHDQGRELAINGRRAVQQNDMVGNAIAAVETRAVFGAPSFENEYDEGGNKKSDLSGTLSSSLGVTAGSADLGRTEVLNEDGVPTDGLFATTLIACLNEKPPSIDDLAGTGGKSSKLSSTSPTKKKTPAVVTHPPSTTPMSPSAIAKLKASQREPREATVKILSPVPKHGQEDAFKDLVGILDADPRHGIKSAIQTEFFEATNGMRSPQGEWMAATYYAQQGIRPLEGLMAVGKGRRYADVGYKLTK